MGWGDHLPLNMVVASQLVHPNKSLGDFQSIPRA